MTGDFNYPNIKWSFEGIVSVLGKNNNHGEKFVDMLNDNSLTQHVLFPTFTLTNGKMSNTLDYIISEASERINMISNGPPLGCANQGHLTLNWIYSFESPIKIAKNHSCKQDFRRGDYVKMSELISNIDWDKTFEDKDTNACYLEFLKIYEHICELSIPRGRTKTGKKRAKWMTNDIMKMIKYKRTLWFKNVSSRWENTSLIMEYKLIKNKVKKLFRDESRIFEENLASDKRNPKRLYAYINSKLKVSNNINGLLDSSGNFKVNKLEIANILNQQFESVFVNEPTELSIPDFDLRTKIRLDNVPITSTIIETFLSKLDPNKTQGNDKVSPFVLNKFSKEWSIPLNLLFNSSMQQGALPNAWLEANVTPIFKKGNKMLPENYRPVSLTSVPCKIMEKLVKKAIVNHLEANDLISKHQHGFVNKKSCVTNLLECLDYSTKTISEKNFMDIILLDFAKAFDKVPHRGLLKKIENYGINGKTSTMDQSFSRFTQTESYIRRDNIELDSSPERSASRIGPGPGAFYSIHKRPS